MFGLAIHGGAGTLPRAEMSSDREQLYRAGLTAALATG
jgi:isoaspartyl peptidase/L-asparaginase-like protein (Ntn-hydrolase superfamily)